MKTAKEIMSRQVITVAPEMGVEELASLLLSRKIGGAPVVDQTGKMIGVVTESDLIDQRKQLHLPTVAAILDALIPLESTAQFTKDFKKMTGTTVADIAACPPLTVTEEDTIEKIATLMATKKVHTIPVVNNKGELVGVVGKSDIIRSIARE